MKKKIIFISIGILILLGGYLIIEPNINKLCQSSSGGNKITIKYSSAFLFGPHKITIKSKNSNIFSTTKFETSIQNDGKTLNETNAEISWESDETAIITLVGEEQSPTRIKVVFDKGITYEIVENN